MSTGRSRDTEKSLQGIREFSINLGKKRQYSRTPGSSRAPSTDVSSRNTPEDEEPGAKRLQELDLRTRDSTSPESGLQIDTGNNPTDDSDNESLSDLPPEALKATSKAQFTAHMRHFLWVQYPSATTTELNAIILRKWKELLESRKGTSGKRRRSEVENLGGADEADEPEDEDAGSRRSSRRRAAKNISQSAYTFDVDEMEYAESPASSSHSRETGRPARRGRTKGGGRGRGGRKGKGGPKVPPMKIKMIGRSGESDSPIFFAESLESWDEGSGSERDGVLRDERVAKLRAQEADSETSSIDFTEIEGERVELEDEEDEEEEDMMEVESTHSDSEGEHADYCQICKDGGELLCCDQCPLAFHIKCLVPPMDTVPDGEWACPRCEAEPLEGKVEKIYAWRWTTVTPSRSGEEDGEDDVMEGGPSTKSPVKLGGHKIREFFVKWLDKSHWKNSWVSEIRMDVYQPITLRAYMRHRNMETPPTLELPPHVQRRHKRRSTASHQDSQLEELEMMLISAGIRPQWLQIQRVINKRVSGRKGTQYLVKWRELPYTSATWETLDSDCGLRGAEEAIQDFNRLRKTMDPKKNEKKEKKERKRGRREKSGAGKGSIKKYEEQPDYISQTGGTLHGYQLEGLNWLRFSWSQATNTILADEMGLGKTIQTISFLYSLYKEGHSNGPFLITAPLSTIVNWERELESWGPELYVVTYSGGKDNRAVIRENEFSFLEGAVKKSSNKLFKMKKDAPCKFHVLLTSYEFISVDATVLGSINWEVLVVDEAHRLKNNQSKFFRVLSGYDIKYKLLLTGTPLQNNLEELFHLLNFLNPQDFNSLEQFQDEFADISKEDQVLKLHELLAPHLLRRLKADVLKNIPPKRELIVRVELSPMQKKYYRWILTRNFEKLNTRGTQPVSLLNIMMDLKKCCNHPYLFPTASHEAALTSTGYYEGTQLTKAAGKFVVLEKMLRKLRQQGHRVLIFSQMTRMLDILEDFMEYLGMGFERIDGNITGTERQRCIDRFNTPGSSQFVFLLSTRAGGLGINLATADTVVIFDSDWNPHNDIQAFSRAHRIGQSNKVMIYRFVTRGSVEERITEVAKRKMMLTHLVVRPGMGQGANAPSLSKRELDDILRFGTEELFKEESVDDDGSSTIHYDDKAIEALLDRSVDMGEGDGAIGSENLLANDYLSSFKVASYVMKETDEEPEAEILTAEGETSQKPDPDFWEKLLRHHYEQQAELEAAKLGKGKRVRKQVNYLDASGGGGHDSDQSSYQQSEEELSEEESDDEVEFTAGGGVASKKKLKSGKMPKSMNDTDLPPLVAKMNDTIYVLGFNPRQRKAFMNTVMRYGMPPPNAYETKWRSKEHANIPQNAYEAYLNLFMRHLCEPEDSKTDTYSDGVPKDNISRQNILTRIGVLRLVKSKIEQYDEINGMYSMPELLSAQPTEKRKPSQPPEEQASTGEQKMNTSDTQPESPESNSNTPTPKSDSNVPTRADSNAPTPKSNADSNAPTPISEDSSNKEIKSLLTNSDSGEATKEESDDQPPKEPVKSAVIVDPPEKPVSQTQRFLFNIADGGFTDLHNRWCEEKTKGFVPSVWGRRHDYWLLKGVLTLGYCRWTEICNDVRFALLNKPFPDTPGDKGMPDHKAKFLLKRFKLLEQALAIEEQLHRASNCNLVQDPNQHVMQLHSRFTDLDCLADGHTPLIPDAMSKNKHSILLMKKALSKMEELLMEMKTDVNRLPNELSKIQSVSKQLKIDEISTISKLAKGSSAAVQSVITQGPAAQSSDLSSQQTVKKEREVVIVQKKKPEGATSSKLVQVPQHATTAHIVKTATGQTVKIPAGSQVAVQTPEGLVIYGGTTSAKASQQQTIVQTVPSSSSTSYTIGVPAAYMDSGSAGLYQAVQLVPVSAASSQQVVYWPVQSAQGTQVSGVPVGSQIAVVQKPQMVQAGTGKARKQGASIITID